MALSRADAEALVLERYAPGKWYVSLLDERPWGWVVGCSPYETSDMLFGGWHVWLVERDSGAQLRVQESVEASVTRYESGRWDPVGLAEARLKSACKFGREIDAWLQVQCLIEAGMDPCEVRWHRLETAQTFTRPDELCQAMREITTENADPIRAERAVLTFLEDPDPRVVSCAAECLGVLARRYGALRKPSEVVAALRATKMNSEVAAACSEALDEIAAHASPGPASEATWDAWIEAARRDGPLDVRSDHLTGGAGDNVRPTRMLFDENGDFYFE